MLFWVQISTLKESSVFMLRWQKYYFPKNIVGRRHSVKVKRKRMEIGTPGACMCISYIYCSCWGLSEKSGYNNSKMQDLFYRLEK